MKSFKPLKIYINTENKKLLIKKHRDCDKTTTAKQNQAGTVVFTKQPLLTTCEKLQNSKNQVKNCKQKIVGLVLETEVPGKKWQLCNFFVKFLNWVCSRLLASETTNYFFLLAQIDNTWLCRSGPRQLFYCLLLGLVQVGLTLFIQISLHRISKTFHRSQTLFVKKVVVKRWFSYIVAAKACFYKTATILYVS